MAPPKARSASTAEPATTQARPPVGELVVSPDSPPECRNLAAVEARLASLSLDAHSRALAELARTLAQTLDAGAGLSTAAISRELRATLAEIDGRNKPADPDDGDLSTPV